MRNSRRFEQASQQNLPTLLFLIIVAITGFTVGNQYRPNRSIDSDPAVILQTEDNAVISELQSALSGSQEFVATTEENPTEDSQLATGLININTASLADLDTLPGVGPSYAKVIIDYRTQNGPFVRLQDIQQVKGIGPKTFEKLKDKITL